ncbi:hypothetical protein B0J14DRAFT_645182 [Halenospora varia]|nr:hypothetical protein B0J14DRAFT_645182 [Halenospora varia]
MSGNGNFFTSGGSTAIHPHQNDTTSSDESGTHQALHNHTPFNTDFDKQKFAEPDRQILVSACVELDALSARCARFPYHSENAHHSLRALFADLDAFKNRFQALSSLAQPQYLLNQGDFTGFTSDRLEPPLTLHDNIIGAGPLDQGLFSVGDLSSAGQDPIVQASTNHGYPYASHGPISTNTTAFQNVVGNYAGMNVATCEPHNDTNSNDFGMSGLIFQPQNETHASQGWWNSDVVPSTEDHIPTASTGNSTNLDVGWNDFVGFDATASMQGPELFGMTPALQQDTNVHPTSTNPGHPASHPTGLRSSQETSGIRAPAVPRTFLAARTETAMLARPQCTSLLVSCSQLSPPVSEE